MIGTSQFVFAGDLESLARDIIESCSIVGYIDISKVLFLRDRTVFKGKVLAKCVKLKDHPVQFYTKKEWCIVFHENRVDYMSDNQLKVLMLHELMHIPPIGDKTIEHNVQDFQTMIDIDKDWSKPNHDIADILNHE